MSGDDVAPGRMIPKRTEHNRLFWTDCGGALVSREVSGNGAVFTYTVNHHPFNPAVPPPYVIAIVELAEQKGLRVATNIVDCEPDSVTIGMPVEVLFEEHAFDDDTVFAPVFAPRRA